MKPPVAACAFVLLAGCATATAERPPVRYACARGGDLSVTFDGATAAVVMADGTSLTLPQVPAASGTHYSKGTHDLRTKGDEAMWTIGRMTPIACQVVRAPRG